MNFDEESELDDRGHSALFFSDERRVYFVMCTCPGTTATWGGWAHDAQRALELWRAHVDQMADDGGSTHQAASDPSKDLGRGRTIR